MGTFMEHRVLGLTNEGEEGVGWATGRIAEDLVDVKVVASRHHDQLDRSTQRPAVPHTHTHTHTAATMSGARRAGRVGGGMVKGQGTYSSCAANSAL